MLKAVASHCLYAISIHKCSLHQCMQPRRRDAPVVYFMITASIDAVRICEQISDAFTFIISTDVICTVQLQSRSKCFIRWLALTNQSVVCTFT